MSNLWLRCLWIRVALEASIPIPDHQSPKSEPLALQIAAKTNLNLSPTGNNPTRIGLGPDRIRRCPCRPVRNLS